MANQPEVITAEIALTIGGTRLAATLSIPTAPTRLLDVLPVLNSLSDAIIGAVVKGVEAEGRAVSCRKGCASCCRQLVPVSEVEARRLRDLVESFPEPRRSAVKARFGALMGRLGEAGLLDRFRQIDGLSGEQRQVLGRDYFASRLDCPFLEEETCSIFGDRPLVCREYMVTSPAELCANPFENGIAGVEMPIQIWPVVARLGEDPPGTGPVRIVPLVLALEWAETHPDDSAARPTPDWVQEFFEKLSGKPIPSATPGMMGSTVIRE